MVHRYSGLLLIDKTWTVDDDHSSICPSPSVVSVVNWKRKWIGDWFIGTKKKHLEIVCVRSYVVDFTSLCLYSGIKHWSLIFQSVKSKLPPLQFNIPGYSSQKSFSFHWFDIFFYPRDWILKNWDNIFYLVRSFEI